MLCPRGHRVIDSTGLHYSLQELPPEPEFAPWDPRSELPPMRAFRYVYGDCDTVARLEKQQEAA